MNSLPNYDVGRVDQHSQSDVDPRYQHPTKTAVAYFSHRPTSRRQEDDWTRWCQDNLEDFEVIGSWDLAVYSETDAILIKMTWG